MSRALGVQCSGCTVLCVPQCDRRSRSHKSARAAAIGRTALPSREDNVNDEFDSLPAIAFAGKRHGWTRRYVAENHVAGVADGIAGVLVCACAGRAERANAE